MTQEHPITPPPELVEKWGYLFVDHTDTEVFNVVAQWGADQELEACCEWFQEFYKTESWVKHDLKHFRAARRPKPPSLKEQALAALPKRLGKGFMATVNDEELNTIRHALEALPDD